MQNEVVAHFLDGRIVKGTSFDVTPAKPMCHIKTDDGVTVVALDDLKALYYVKSLMGDSERNDATEEMKDDIRLRGSKRLELVFKDTERLVVLSNRFPPQGARFFVLPIDPASNNDRILVNQAALESVSLIPD